MKSSILFLCLVAIPIAIFSQNIEESARKVKNYVSSEYDRNAITFIGIDYGDKLSGEVLTQFIQQIVPDKYYDNSISTKILKYSGKRDTLLGVVQPLAEPDMVKLLNDNKVGQQILSVWFNRQSDGSFNVEKLKERGLFNANDNEFMVASASKRGESSLMDMGMGLVDQSYVVAFDFFNILTMDQVYAQNEVPAEKRIMNGFNSSVNYYLYKLDFNDSVAAVFFQNYWTTPADPDRQAKVAAFENARFPFKQLTSQQKMLTSTQFNPGQTLAPKVQKTSAELMDVLCKQAIESSFVEAEKRVQDFRVKAMVSGVNPISAKIGKKEGLRFDSRYFVYENRERRNGDILSKRVAVVKSMFISDNLSVTRGQTQPSAFYQIAGGKVDNMGMFLEQNNDIGLNVVVGATTAGLPGVTARAEYYISKAFGGFSKDPGAGKMLTSWKIYAEGGIGMDSYDLGGYVDDFTFARVSFGVNKDFYPLSFLHWGPFLGYGMESATWSGSDSSISTDFIELGGRVGLNVKHNIQLIASANYYMMLTSEMLDANKEVLDSDFDYKGTFEDRFGLGYSLGLRIMF